jgi:hypothetical protein
MHAGWTCVVCIMMAGEGEAEGLRAFGFARPLCLRLADSSATAAAASGPVHLLRVLYGGDGEGMGCDGCQQKTIIPAASLVPTTTIYMAGAGG